MNQTCVKADECSRRTPPKKFTVPPLRTNWIAASQASGFPIASITASNLFPVAFTADSISPGRTNIDNICAKVRGCIQARFSRPTSETVQPDVLTMRCKHQTNRAGAKNQMRSVPFSSISDIPWTTQASGSVRAASRNVVAGLMRKRFFSTNRAGTTISSA